jgi:hypothetical protein
MIARFLCVKVWVKQKNKDSIQYPSESLAIRPLPHGPKITVLTSLLLQTGIFSISDAKDNYVHFSSDTESKNPQPFNQLELNYLVRDLGLTKEKSELEG